MEDGLRQQNEDVALRHSIRHAEASSKAGSTSLPASPVKLKRRRSTRRQYSTLSAGSLGSDLHCYMMIPKSFNEEIRVTEYGPKMEVTYDSAFVYEGSRQFKSEVEYEQRYSTRRYESSLSLKPDTKEYVYRECLELSPRLRPRTYSETIYAFPKTVDKIYTTTLRHWDNYVETRYVTGVKLVPAARLKTPSSTSKAVNGGNHLAYRQTKSLDDDTLLKDCPEKTNETTVNISLDGSS